MNEEIFLSNVKNASITPEMYKAINTQTARYFKKSEEYVIFFELYNNIDKDKSFTSFEKAVIAYRSHTKISEFDTDSYLSYWYPKIVYGGNYVK